MGKNILITGSSGLIGNRLLSTFRNSDHRIFAIDKAYRNSYSYLTCLDIDLASNWSGTQLPEKLDIIIHLAQSENFRLFPDKAEDIFNVNIQSTLKLASYALKAGVKKFIYASSGGIYGFADQPFSEEYPVNFNQNLGFYLASKYCSEVLLDNFTTYFDVITLRPFFVYGKEQRSDMLIPRLIHSVQNGIPVRLQGKDGIKINPLHVEDAAAAIKAAMMITGSHKINIAGPEILSVRQICDLIGEYAGVLPVYETDEAAIPNNIMGDIRKMSSILVPPTVKFSDALREFFE